MESTLRLDRARAHVRAVAGELASAVAERLGGPERLLPLLLRAVPPWPDADPPSTFGFYVSADGRAPDRVRLIVQPATDCEPAELRRLLSPFGAGGTAAADLLDALGLDPGFYRGGFETAIGLDGRHVRVYAGVLDGSGLDVERLVQAGWWPPPLATRAERALNGLLGALVGCARRLGGPIPHCLYFRGIAPLAEVELPVSLATLSDFVALCGGGDAFGRGTYGWQLSLDAAGELVDWKLDAFDPPPSLVDSLPDDQELAPFLAWCRATAAAAGTGIQINSASLRCSPAGETITVYVQFVCPPTP
jgi:hypothetical protein